MKYPLKFYQAKNTYAENAIAQNKMQDLLLQSLIKNQGKNFETIFEFGAGVGNFTQKIIKNLSFKTLLCNDLFDFSDCFLSMPKNVSFMAFDMLSFSHYLKYQTFDLILSNAALQWLNAEWFFRTIPLICKPNTTLAISTFGPNNLFEISSLTQLSLPYLSLKELQKILQKHSWQILELYESSIPLYFQTPIQALKSLKLTGVNTLNPSFKITKSLLQDLEKIHHNTLTYHAIIIIAKRSPYHFRNAVK